MSEDLTELGCTVPSSWTLNGHGGIGHGGNGHGGNGHGGNGHGGIANSYCFLCPVSDNKYDLIHGNVQIVFDTGR